MALSDTIARVIELPMGGRKAAENAHQAKQKQREQRQQIELTLAKHRNIDAVCIGLGEQAMSRDADVDVITTIFDLLAEQRITPDAGRSLLGELARQPQAGEDILTALEKERQARSRANHPAGANIQQITVSSV